MDRKTIIILAACVLLLLAWQPLTQTIWPPIPLPPGSTNAPAPTALGPTNRPAASPATNAPAELRAAPPLPVLTPPAPEETIILTNGPARYVFTSHRGGLKEVQLTTFPEVVHRSQKVISPTNFATLNDHALTPILASLDGPTFDGDGVFRLTRTATGVRAEKTLTNGLVVVKEFEPTTNYLILASVRVTNASAAVVNLPPQRWITGTAMPLDENDTGLTLGLMWYNGASATDISKTWFDNASFLSCIGLGAKQPRTEYLANTTNVVWAAAHNQFFSLIAMPDQPASDVYCRAVSLPRPPQWPSHAKAGPPTIQGYETSLIFPAAQLPPGQATRHDIVFYAGPKEYRVLTRVSDRLANHADLVMGFGGFFGYFAKLLLISMNGLHDVLHLGYGWVIILITIIIKALFWPLTQISTRSMKRMQALQPEMKKIQEKYKDDPAKMNKKTMEFMREHKVSPLGGCLPMLIQLPIFFGFYRMIQSAIELRGESFLWVADLSRPDTLFHIMPGTFDFPFNLLPLLMGATMLWQARLTPVSPGMDPAQQKMMKYMPLMFLFILYNFSAGLTLYWTVQNLLSILQTKLTKTNEPAPAAVVSSKSLAPTKKKAR
jgi:YidC/Oxa1 family membrane protein insertase